MRDDEGQAYMSDLMALARPVNIGKIVFGYRISNDSGTAAVHCPARCRT